VVLNYNLCKDGLCPGQDGPWLRATIEDFENATVKGVTIKLESLLKNANEFFQGRNDNPGNPVGIAFNITTPIPANIFGTCSANTGSNGCLGDTPQFSIQDNGVNLPGDAFKGFDLALFLAPPPTPAATNRFDGSDVIQFFLLNNIATATNFLTASSFLTTNNDGAGAYCSAARVASLANGGSTVIAARCAGEPPTESVPAPLPLFGAGMAFGLSRRMRQRIRRSSESSTAAIG
jgi:hypothetical protein